jgi:hypothetical protein
MNKDLGVVGEIDTRRFTGSALTLIKAKHCIEKDLHILHDRKNIPNLFDLEKFKKNRQHMSIVSDSSESSSLNVPVPVEQLTTLNDKSSSTTLAHASIDTFGSYNDSSSVGDNGSILHSQTTNVLRNTLYLPKDEKKIYIHESTIRSGFLRPLESERTSSLLHPELNYFSKWQIMKDKRDAREVSIIRRNVRHEMIRDISQVAFNGERCVLIHHTYTYMYMVSFD